MWYYYVTYFACAFGITVCKEIKYTCTLYVFISIMMELYLNVFSGCFENFLRTKRDTIIVLNKLQ